MKQLQKTVIAVNVGSSSLKLTLFDTDSLNEIVDCSVENIGQKDASLYIKTGDNKQDHEVTAENHTEALDRALSSLASHLENGEVVGIGHRIVFTGTLDQSTRIIDDSYMTELKQLEEVDPDHTPFVCAVLQEMRDRFSDVPHVACSDSGFFADLPVEASMLPLPREYYDQGIKKYGYHGLSYAYVMSKLAEEDSQLAAHGKVVIAHLGSGVSLAAIQAGKPIDTTMGFSPTSGVPMSSRSGDLDPSVVTHIMQRDNLSPEEFNEIVNGKSGLLGVSGSSADMYTLLQQEASDSQAEQAISIFCYQISKAVGSLAAAMGGIDGLVFTAGIGSRSARIRSLVCERLQHLNIVLDAAGNEENRQLISQANSVPVHVMQTNETQIIVQETVKVISTR